MKIVIKFDGRGKQMISLESESNAMLNMWALQNTKGKQLSIVTDEETKEITLVVKGNGSGYPKVFKKKEEIAALGLEINFR